MSKILDLLQLIVNEKQEQLDRVIASGGTPFEQSEAREALLRDQLVIALREEQENPNSNLVNESSSEEVQSKDTLQQLKSKFAHLKASSLDRQCKPGCELGRNFGRRHFGPCKDSKGNEL